MKNEKLNKWLFWIGLVIVIGTHIYMLTYGLPANQMTGHAVLNLIAAALIGSTKI